MRDAGARFRLTLLGGFLGAGKTTWLRHHLHAGVFLGALVIVNEAANAPVDPVLLGSADRVHVLAGGCACCDGRAELLRLLRELCDSTPAASEGAAIPRIVLETSGLADPRAIVEAIASDPGLSKMIEVSDIVVMVDAVNGLDLLRGETLARRQIAGANCLIVSKVDAVHTSDLKRLVEALQGLNPTAARFGSVRGLEAPLPECDGSGASAPDLSGSTEASAPYAVDIRVGDIAWPVLAVWLSALLHARGDALLRVKGVVATPAGRLLIQAVRRSVQPPEILPGPGGEADGVLVVLGRGHGAPDLRNSLEAFATAARGHSRAAPHEPGDALVTPPPSRRSPSDAGAAGRL